MRIIKNLLLITCLEFLVLGCITPHPEYEKQGQIRGYNDQDLRNLQNTIDSLVKDIEFVRLIDEEEARINAYCKKKRKNHSHFDKVISSSRGYIFSNYEEFLPGVRRFEAPSLQTLKAARKMGMCRRLATLNGECVVNQYLKENRALDENGRQEVLKKMQQKGYKDYYIKNSLEFYQNNRQLCEHTREDKNHKFFHLFFATRDIAELFAALEWLYEGKVKGEDLCFHCTVGKHRTGIVSMLLEIASLEKITDQKLTKIYQKYKEHTWYRSCNTQMDTLLTVPLIIKSKPFIQFQKRWRPAVRNSLSQ